MIVRFASSAPPELIDHAAELGAGRRVRFRGEELLVFPAAEPPSAELVEKLRDAAELIDFEEDWPLASRRLFPENTVIDLGDGVVFGDDRTVLIAGPCAAESEEQLRESAVFLRAQGVRLFRAGLFKPRTSAYNFSGLEEEGLGLLAAVRREHGLKLITEVYDSRHFDAIEEIADVIQIGSKAMFNLALLRRCGRSSRPILLKRFFSASVKEWLQAAEVILSGGNERVILAERGIRTFETRSRFSLDLNSAIYVREHSHLPLLLDPSHAIGRAGGVPPLARCCAALGVDGVMVEVHPHVEQARCDRAQALTHDAFARLREELARVCQAVGRRLV